MSQRLPRSTIDNIMNFRMNFIPAIQSSQPRMDQRSNNQRSYLPRNLATATWNRGFTAGPKHIEEYFLDEENKILDTEVNLRPAVREYMRSIKNIIWEEKRQFFPQSVQSCRDMPEIWWQQCKQWMLDELAESQDATPGPQEVEPWTEFCKREGLFISTSDTPSLRLSFTSKVQYLDGSPRITSVYLECLLTYTPLTVADACKKFNEEHYECVVLDSQEIIQAINKMSTKQLAVIYMLLFAKDRFRTAADNRETRYGNPRMIILLKQWCIYCFDKGSHYSNQCVRMYTREMREAACRANGTCLQCGEWGPHENGTFNNHPSGSFKCNSCCMNHKSWMCSANMKVKEVLRVTEEVRLVVTATLGFAEEDWVGLYRNVIQFFMQNPNAPNAFRYVGMPVSRFDGNVCMRAQKNIHGVKVRKHSPARPFPHRPPRPAPRY